MIRLYCTDHSTGPTVSVTSTQNHIITSIIISTTACFQRDDDLVAGRVAHPTRTTWFEKLAFPECCRLCLQGDSAGTGLAEGGEGREGGRGRGHHQKALAHAQYWESAIHSLSTGPFLSSLLSFTLMIVSERVQPWKIWIREMKLYCDELLGPNNFRMAWEAR